MGMPNSGMFLSEKDLNTMEFNSLSRPALEFENGCENVPNSIDGDDQLQEESRKELQKDHEKGGDQLEISSVEYFIKRPSRGESKELEDEADDENDGFRTPTCLDQRSSSTPLIPRCPPAPRKPKSLPLMKRKAVARRRILLDLSDEIESFFPPALLADLGSKNKKVKKMNVT